MLLRSQDGNFSMGFTWTHLCKTSPECLGNTRHCHLGVRSWEAAPGKPPFFLHRSGQVTVQATGAAQRADGTICTPWWPRTKLGARCCSSVYSSIAHACAFGLRLFSTHKLPQGQIKGGFTVHQSFCSKCPISHSYSMLTGELFMPL